MNGGFLTQIQILSANTGVNIEFCKYTQFVHAQQSINRHINMPSLLKVTDAYCDLWFGAWPTAKLTTNLILVDNYLAVSLAGFYE